MEPQRLVRLALIAEGGLALLALALGAVSERALPPGAFAASLPAIAAGFIAPLPLMVLGQLAHQGYEHGSGLLHRSYRQMVEVLRPALGSTVTRMNWWQINTVSIAAGVGEEMLFRGVLQAWLGLWITSLLFGLAHAMNATYFLVTVGVGLYFGALYEWSGNLWTPIIAHAVYDVVAFYALRQLFARPRA